MKVGVGFSQDDGIRDLAREAADEAMGNAGVERAQTAIVASTAHTAKEYVEILGEVARVTGAAQIVGASTCDAAAARKMVVGLNELNRVALDHTNLIDEPLWLAELQKLAAADHLNPLLSGYACALLLERSLISDEELAREVSRRLSPGIEADLGFECL